jgi:hypothetical protein
MWRSLHLLKNRLQYTKKTTIKGETLPSFFIKRDTVLESGCWPRLLATKELATQPTRAWRLQYTAKVNSRSIATYYAVYKLLLLLIFLFIFNHSFYSIF